MKSRVPTKEDLFKTNRSYTPEEILAAGGTTAFGIKTGKNNEHLIKALENSPKPEPFTKQEWISLLSELEKDK